MVRPATAVNKKLHEHGYEFAARGVMIPYPHDAPAVEAWIYRFGLLDELAVNAYWTKRYRRVCGSLRSTPERRQAADGEARAGPEKQTVRN